MRQPFDEKLPFRTSSSLLRAHKVSETATLILILFSPTILVLFQDSNIQGRQFGKGGAAIFKLS
jgi:hypothetical protein